MPRGINPDEPSTFDYGNSPENRLRSLTSKKEQLGEKINDLAGRLSELKNGGQGNNIFSRVAIKVKSFFTEKGIKLALAVAKSGKSKIENKIEKIEQSNKAFAEKQEVLNKAVDRGYINPNFNDPLSPDLQSRIDALNDDDDDDTTLSDVTIAGGGAAPAPAGSLPGYGSDDDDDDMTISEMVVRGADATNMNEIHEGYTAVELNKILDIKFELLKYVKANGGKIPEDIEGKIKDLFSSDEVKKSLGNEFASDMEAYFLKAFNPDKKNISEVRLGAIENIMKGFVIEATKMNE